VGSGQERELWAEAICIEGSLSPGGTQPTEPNIQQLPDLSHLSYICFMSPVRMKSLLWLHPARSILSPLCPFGICNSREQENSGEWLMSS
jgi:hypothetical protein